MKGVKELNNDIIANDTLLSSKEAETVREAVIQKAEATLNMRGALPVNQVSSGTQTWEYRVIENSGEGNAAKVVKGADYPQVRMSKTTTKKDIVKMGVSFELFREDILSARQNNMDLTTVAARRASRNVAEKENDLILNGDSTYGINGLLDQVTSSIGSNSSSGWEEDGISTFGVADIKDDMKAEITDGLASGPFTLIMPRAEFEHLEAVDPNVNRMAMEVLQGTGGLDRIMWDPDMPSGTALFMARDPEVAEYVLAEDISTVGIDDGDDDVQKYKVRTRGVPVVYQSGGLVKMTGI